MNTVSLHHLWSYLQGLSLTANNQRWLSERLIEASSATHKKNIRHGKAYHHQLERLNELASLQDNWDDDGAPPIERQVVSNVKEVLDISPESLLSKWVLFPDTNGTLIIKLKGMQASISIGIKSYSYSYKKENEAHRANNCLFVASDVLELISAIIG
jgi:hypothetical protein